MARRSTLTGATHQNANIMETDNNKKYIVTVDLDLPPLQSGLAPYNAYPEFPSPRSKIQGLVVSIRRLFTLLKWAQHSEVIILDSTSGPLQPDLAACILIRFFKRKPVIVMTGDMWNRGNIVKYSLQKLSIKLADRVIQRYVVQSLGEKEIFPKLWGVAPQKVQVCLYHFTFTDDEIGNYEVAEKGYIFAGGNPSRNYDLLLDAARLLPNRKFVVAARTLNGRKDIPANVQVVQVGHQEFIRLMRQADMVITPLRAGGTRAAGQQTYLNAIRMGKISIVNGKDVLGVTDYIQNYTNGIVFDGTPQALRKTIEWVYDPTNREAVKNIQRDAPNSVKEFTYERHLRTMASIIEGTIAESKNQSGT